MPVSPRATAIIRRGDRYPRLPLSQHPNVVGQVGRGGGRFAGITGFPLTFKARVHPRPAYGGLVSSQTRLICWQS